MGFLDEGRWVTQGSWSDPSRHGGAFVRRDTTFRNWVTVDGQAGPSGEGGFVAEPNRYHLYVSLACPWAHRTLIYRKLLNLESVIGVSIVDWLMGDDGWVFNPERAGATIDHLGGADFLRDVYLKVDPQFSGRVTVPILWDKRQNTIVSNESSEIIRMLNTAFKAIGQVDVDFYPAALRAEIDALNADIYPNLNNGVYRCGFATTQTAYETAYDELFACLDRLEERLSHNRYLLGDQITEADWRAFPTLVRFDPVYVSHFKTDRNRLADMPHLFSYLRALYQWPGIADTVNFEHIKHHYFVSHRNINPTGIVPKGPALNLLAPHGRDVGD